MQEQACKVSVILPVYNVQLFLADCLESILHQSLKEIEILAINDGSTDHSLQILEKYALQDNRLKIISQENKGLSAARNVAMRQAKGTYISFVDSDDWIDPSFLENLYHAAETEKADFAVGGALFYGKSATVETIYENDVYFVTTDLREKIEKSYVVVWNKIYRRDKLLEHNLFFREGARFEDMYWTPHVMEKLEKGVWVPQTFYHYRYSYTSITKGPTDIEKKNEGLAAQTYFNYFLYSRHLRTPQEDIEAFKWSEKRKYSILGMRCLTVFIGENKKAIYLFGLPLLRFSVKK